MLARFRVHLREQIRDRKRRMEFWSATGCGSARTRCTSKSRACRRRRRRRDYVRRMTRSSPFLAAAIFQQNRGLRDRFPEREEEFARA